MIIGIPADVRADQKSAAATPDTVKKLIKLGYGVRVQAGAGAGAKFPDALYEAAGANVCTAEEAWGADVVVCLDAPDAAAPELTLLHEGATLIARMNPAGNAELLDALAARNITGLALDAVPRISRAQAMDVRSSMMNIAGYRAVVEAAAAYGRTFSGQVTAAGKVPPARVYVIGVGVAGLAAIGAAGAMGAEVYATDVRADVAEQVESLGATFVEIPVQQQSADGYARPLTEEEQAQVLQVYANQAAQSDIVITTAQVPGRAAPLLLTAEAVAGMAPGSVVVDMGASPLGGNCALSQADETIETENGVTVVGITDLPARMPAQASQLFGQNIVNLLKLMTPGKDGQLQVDEDDAIVRGMLVARDGDITWPPPAISVSAAPAATPKAEAEAKPKAEPKAELKADPKVQAAVVPAKTSGGMGRWLVLAAAVLLAVLVFAAPASMQTHFTVFALACVVGFYVITGVSHSLHTPLMSVTNAISGIIIVGAILQLAAAGNIVIAVLAGLAALVASINIFGGFLVTDRMLAMFEGSVDSHE